jgi:hypothetical protein
VQNGYIESFNGKFRDECLNQHWFSALIEARGVIADWRRDYNQVRPHPTRSVLCYQCVAWLQEAGQSCLICHEGERFVLSTHVILGHKNKFNDTHWFRHEYRNFIATAAVANE